MGRAGVVQAVKETFIERDTEAKRVGVQVSEDKRKDEYNLEGVQSLSTCVHSSTCRTI